MNLTILSKKSGVGKSRRVAMAGPMLCLGPTEPTPVLGLFWNSVVNFKASGRSRNRGPDLWVRINSRAAFSRRFGTLTKASYQHGLRLAAWKNKRSRWFVLNLRLWRPKNSDITTTETKLIPLPECRLAIG
jgi:hypothetical protein